MLVRLNRESSVAQSLSQAQSCMKNNHHLYYVKPYMVRSLVSQGHHVLIWRDLSSSLEQKVERLTFGSLLGGTTTGLLKILSEDPGNVLC